MGKRKTHEEFVEEMKIINPEIEILGQYVLANKSIEVKCSNCSGIWSPIANSLFVGQGCPYCCPTPRKVVIGLNDMWTTNSELAQLLLNSDDGYKYTKSSSIKINWKCPECGNIIKNNAPHKINRYGLSCNRCSDGISYPEKFMSSLLFQLGIDFETEKS